jgi:hypothetical protein
LVLGIGALHLLRSAPYYLKRVIALLEKKVMNWEKSANYFFISVGLKQKVRRIRSTRKIFHDAPSFNQTTIRGGA